MATPQSELPRELWDTIIDELRSDVKAIKTCSQVCQAFNTRVQKIYYRRITLNILTPDPYSFKSLMERFPHLCGYVRSLTLNTHDQLQRLISTAPEPVEAALASILPLLGNLEALSISRYSPPSDMHFLRSSLFIPKTDWNSWVPELQTAVLDKCRSVALVDLHLDTIKNVPFSIFSHIPTLKSLAISNVCFANAEPLEAPSLDQHQSIAMLQTLSIKDEAHVMSGPLSTWMQSAYCPLDLTGLISLSLDVKCRDGTGSSTHTGSNDGLSLVSFIFCKCSSSLQELHYIHPFEDQTATLLDLDTMPSLRKLSISGTVWNWNNIADTRIRLQTLLGILSSIPSPCHIVTIRLQCDSIGSIGYDEWNDWPPSSSLPDFSSVISRLSQAASFDVEIGTPLWKYFQEQLAPCLKRGTLHMTETGFTNRLSLKSVANR
ncbi:hypothetical protein B0H34DRAFT_798400 [Crassisporium funariophilum]|nr:hypothetical protein B0H34DRAFT_798400 [Crassisporium funariophilum]